MKVYNDQGTKEQT